MSIDELARKIRRRKLENPNLGAIALMTLSVCNAGSIARETPLPIPAAPVVSKREDDGGQVVIAHGPELHEPELAPALPADNMPPGRGMTYTMEDAFPHRRANTSAIFHLLRNGAAAHLQSMARCGSC